MVPIHNNGEKEDPDVDTDTLGSLEYYSTGTISFVASLVCLVVFYPALVGLTQPLHVLSTTAIVVTFLVVWAVTWLALEFAWCWRLGRLSEL